MQDALRRMDAIERAHMRQKALRNHIERRRTFQYERSRRVWATFNFSSVHLYFDHVRSIYALLHVGTDLARLQS